MATKTAGKENITDWRIIAMSGTTADGREISEQEITEMADQYDPATYTARINLEHFRLAFPYDDIGGLGDVVELKAEKQDNGKTALLARLKVNDNLQAIWNADQKVFSSIEIASPFADSGQAYLVGMAVTDTPASLSTTRHFSLAKANAAKKHSSISEYTEMTQAQTKPAQTEHTQDNQKPAIQTADHGATEAAAKGMFSAMMDKFFNKAATEPVPEKNKTIEPEPRQFAAHEDVTKLQADLADAGKAFAALAEKHKQLADDFAAFKSEVESTPASGARQPHLGADDLPKTDF